MEPTEGEKVILEKLESMHDPITSYDLRDVDPKTTKEFLMIMFPVQISLLKRLEKINGSLRR